MCVELDPTKPSTYVSNRLQHVIPDIYCGSVNKGPCALFTIHLVFKLCSCAIQGFSHRNMPDPRGL